MTNCQRIATVSVAMTTYRPNRGFLLEQLDSIVAQTRQVDEVVITDDASKDGTVQFLNDYIAGHGLSGWRVQERDSNGGVGKSFRDSIAACHGDLIFLCDQDDIWLRDKVSRFAALFEGHREIECLLGNYYLIDRDAERITSSAAGDNLFFQDWDERVSDGLYRVPVQTILCHNVAPGATQAFTARIKEAFLEVHGHKRMHDWRIGIAAALQCDGLYYTTDALTLYRQHDSNVVGVRDGYLQLRDKADAHSRLTQSGRALLQITRQSWVHRKDPYGRLSCFEFENNSAKGNAPKTIRKVYFPVCKPMGKPLDEYQEWEEYIGYFRRAVDSHSLMRLVKMRYRYRQCHRAHFQYWNWQERFACLLKDINWCCFARVRR